MAPSPTGFELANLLGARLRSTQQRVTTAESCTGGMIAAAITAIPGSSGWFDMGFITYSNQAKHQLLDIDLTILAREGAVSEVVVKLMAAAARNKAGADMSVAVSGIAGPGGGSPDKPVGTVWLAWADAEGVRAQRLQVVGDRDEVRQASVLCGLRGLLELAGKKTV